MTDFERFAAALAKTESKDSELAWGDPKEPKGLSFVTVGTHQSRIGGAGWMAMGRWQIHPAWYHDWVPLKVPVEASWDEMFREALENFWNNGIGVGDDPLRIAMKFHLGTAAVLEGHWCVAYGKRFAAFYDPKTEES